MALALALEAKRKDFGSHAIGADFKGRAGAISYTIDGFYIDWKDPQVSGLTPNANFAVWNAKAAESKGFEFDLNTPLGLPGLSLMASGTYAEATLTELDLRFHLAGVQLDHAEWLLVRERPDDAEHLLADARDAFESLGAAMLLSRAEAASAKYTSEVTAQG